jgi:dTDP-4-dehydrorhamnose 3,5-epimerase-like enzyme
MIKERLFNLQRHEGDNGFLCVFQRGINVDFDIRRVFAVSSSEGNIRGEHAHKKCSQLLVCVAGKILVTCDNGSEKSEYLLNGMQMALLIPPGIWAKQEYLTKDALLLVVCDRDYEPEDYIHDYGDYKKSSIGII